ncbi:hypothetical protein ES704_01629 [subsurface metagenome]|jgi:hypothetical protein
MNEVKVTLSDEMVEFLKGICEAQQKLAVAAEHINAASEALSKLGLKQEDVASIVASRAGVSKTAVNKIFSVLRRRDLDAYEILAMFIASKQNIGKDQARRTIRCLMELVTQVQGETTDLTRVEGGKD